MSSIQRSSLFNVSDALRQKYPEAILGFLGNSLAALAVADRYTSNHEKKTQQFIIPYSGTCLDVPDSSAANKSMTGQHSYWPNRVISSEHIKKYLLPISQSAISPDKIIPQNNQIVMVDRVSEGSGLVSFGYMWNLLAQQQGYSQKQINLHFGLCPISDSAADTYIAYDASHRETQKIFYQGKFKEAPSLARSDILRILKIDSLHYTNGASFRLAPKKNLRSLDDVPDQKKYYTRIGKLYSVLASNKKEIYFSSLMYGTKPDKTTLDNVSGLIIS